MNSVWWLEWTDGGTAQLVQTDGVFATLHSTRQAATGTPLSATLSATPPATPPATQPKRLGGTVQFKVKDCMRREDGVFVLIGRWVNLSKTTREQLVGCEAKESNDP